MVSGDRLTAFIPTRDADRARAFYVDVLGLTLVDEDQYAITLDANGTRLRVTKAPPFTPYGFTALGWSVSDIAASVAELAGRGVVFEKYAGLGQDEAGIWTTPDGSRVAWFKDPDGNLLSLDQQSTGSAH